MIVIIITIIIISINIIITITRIITIIIIIRVRWRERHKADTDDLSKEGAADVDVYNCDSTDHDRNNQDNTTNTMTSNVTTSSTTNNAVDSTHGSDIFADKDTTTNTNTNKASNSSCGTSAPPTDHLPPCLIVCPATVLANWKLELTKWGYFSVSTLTSKDANEAIKTTGKGNIEILLSSYPMASRWCTELAGVKWSLIILTLILTLTLILP
jgi:hypothetical protein